MTPRSPLAPAPAAPAFPAAPTTEAVAALTARGLARESSAAFQSLLAAALGAVGRLRGHVRAAEHAALCLAHREHAAAVASDLARTQQALRAGLASGAECLAEDRPSLSAALRGLLRPDRERLVDAARAVRGALRLPAPEAAPPTASGKSAPTDWFSATARAVEALGETAAHLDALAVAQPDASASRELGLAVAAVLRRSRDTLLADIARLAD